ncbi:DUF4389 domain-containing protein [Rhodococcus cerastii]|uniref:DUF4389 domain-containing protein n=2 Tax=Rhodococcus TaxID=1827 RepID=A0ABU4D4Q9_9NOCA|nr:MULTISPECIES: DUF4389 domain-containing protein [Rhodococcus]MDI9927198.1 DUF4389 domain-containing protein [Rhodococcus sp. IEGM 1341]MDV6304716.1 DUF4389 domain-containing protein [Rhodococcus cerastii]MDV8077823.1 DUF4389 domain-containing protein [Rhodococcus sp. IEGM 1370]
MGTNRVFALVIGCVVSLVAFAVLGVGVLLFFGYVAQDDEGRISLPTAPLTTASSALVSEDVSLVDSIDPQVSDRVTVSVRVASSDPAREVLIGIAPTADVRDYLRGVAHTVVTDVEFFPFRAGYDNVTGSDTAASPLDQPWWFDRASGTGTTELEWRPQGGSWTMVVMNADGSAGVDVDVRAGVRVQSLGPVAASVLAASALLLVLGVGAIVFGASGLGRRTASETAAESKPLDEPDTLLSATEQSRYPVVLTGTRPESLSRGLWLVKWILAVPHYIVLVFLLAGFFVTTFVAGLAILFTGRYPRGLFDFNVGVLRWVWRVQFYSYSALGTDRYPPFTLHRTDHPADLVVDYPEKLSRGKVLVKWWLLAIPHYLVLSLLAGGWYAGFRIAGNGGDAGVTGQPYIFGSVLGVLVLIAGITLLFTGRYPRGLFDLVLGINRWVFRVAAYAALMTDEYPPFRLDQGPDEVESAQKDRVDDDVSGHGEHEVGEQTL